MSIVPAVFGVCYNLFHCWRGGEGPRVERIDYFVSALWVCTSFLSPYPCLTPCPSIPKGSFNRLPVSIPNNWPPPPLGTLLSPVTHPNPPPRPTSDLLARDAYHSPLPRTSRKTGSLLVCSGDMYMCEPECTDLGDK